MVTCQTVSRLEHIRDKHPEIRPILYQPGAASVAFNRNLIVKEFLDTDAELLIMVDDDVVPPVDLLDVLDPFPDGYGMVGIPYPIGDPQTGVPMFCVYELDDEKGIRAADMEQGLNECDAVATGCVAIPRGVLEYFGPNCFRFDADPREVIHGEDVLFCRDLRDAGYKVGYTTAAGFCDHIRVTSLEPVTGVMGMLLRRAQEAEAALQNTIVASDDVVVQRS